MKMLLVLVMLLAMALPGFASADEASLTVIGTASVTVQPDMARGSQAGSLARQQRRQTF